MTLEQLQAEYWSLTDEALALSRLIINGWHTASVQQMRQHNARMHEINDRLSAIRALKSHASTSKKFSVVDVVNPRSGHLLDTKLDRGVVG